LLRLTWLLLFLLTGLAGYIAQRLRILGVRHPGTEANGGKDEYESSKQHKKAPGNRTDCNSRSNNGIAESVARRGYFRAAFSSGPRRPHRW
jgi:hypothetical protein